MRGQVALEFLVTYGWALLVVLVMIGAISYFGVVNPSRLLPDKCVTSPDFSCVDFVILGEDEEVRLLLKQGIGKTIYFRGASCEYEGNMAEGTVTIDGVELSANDPWGPRSTAEVVCSFPSLGFNTFTGTKLRVFYNVTYALSPGGFSHEIEGHVYSGVQ